METNEVSEVTGDIDEVYTTKDSNIRVNDEISDSLLDNGTPEYTEGWMQLTLDERQKVRRMRISHAMCVWKPV